jgi:hypothetical protein
MDVPLWLALIVIGALGIKLVRPPWWLVAVIVVGGYLLAGSSLSAFIPLTSK